MNQLPSLEELKILAGSDLILEVMLEDSIPLTRANYLALMLVDKDKTEADLDAEQLETIPDWLK